MVNKKEKQSPKAASSAKKSEKFNLVDLVVKGMLEKKGHSVTVLDLRKIKSAVADYFVICSANTDTQLDAIRHSVEEEVYKATGQDVWMKEGIQNKEWILLDYADVVVHIFRTDRREFYGLEDLWGDAEISLISEDESITKVTKPVKKKPLEKKEGAVKTVKKTPAAKASKSPVKKKTSKK